VLSHLVSTLSSPTPSARASWNTPSFWQEARDHGVLPLAVERVGKAEWLDVSQGLRLRLRREAVDEATRAELAAADLRRVLAALRDATVHPILLKGAALAYTHYRYPGLRPRLDTDMLIRPADVEASHRVFRALHAEYLPHVTGTYVMSQFHYVTRDGFGCAHAYDIHWRIAVPIVFSQTLQFDEIDAGAEPIGELGPHARGPSPEHALILACVHRAAHHSGSDRLIWLYDIHLVAERLTPQQQDGFVALAIGRGVAAVASDGLAAARDRFHGTVTTALHARLSSVPRRSEPLTSGFLRARRTPVRDAIANLRALGGTRQRLRLMRELVLPPAGYMREVYARGSRAPLPLLYLRRLVVALGRKRPRR
jgi:hypothetical protein